MLNNVAVVALDRIEAFELGVVCEVFGLDRSDDGLPVYDFAVVAGEPGPIRCNSGFTISTPYGLDRLEEADLIAVPAVSDRRFGAPLIPGLSRRPMYPGRTHPDMMAPGPAECGHFPPELLAALRRAVDRGAWVLSVCSGAFVLGEAGLLDGRRCTTHWRNAAELARRFPRAIIDPNVLYVDDAPVITSAGTGAGIDACLHLVRKVQGSRVANGIARRMVVPPHREGGQAQYIDRPLGESPGGSLDGAQPQPAAIRGQHGRAGAHVATHVCPQVCPGDRDLPAALADLPAGPGGPAAAGGDRRDRGCDRRPRRLR